VTTKKALLLGCGGVAFLGLVSASAIGFFLYHVSQDVEGLGIAVKQPDEVTIGQSFDLEIVVRNDRSKKPLQMTDIDLAEEYLEGFMVSSVVPAYKSSAHVPLDNKRSYTFNLSIPAGESRTFVFKMRARKAGLFRGDADVCEGLQFRTDVLQTEVHEKP